MHETFAPYAAQNPGQARPANSLRSFDQQRSELSSQLTSLTIQRDLLTQQLRNADVAGQQQLQAQIKAVADRTTQVIKQMAAVDEAASKAMADAQMVVAPNAQAQGGTTVVTLPPPIRGRFDSGSERVAIAIVVGLTIILVMAMQFFRRPRSANTALSAGDVGRLERLQQSVDVIAVEVERISEAQRYMSKALGEGPADAIRVAARERAKAP